jgi:putative N6-adenine-specific DNA methylase
VVAPGLEAIAVSELRALGVAVPDAERGGVAFETTEAELARVLLGVRTLTRVLVRVAEFRAVSFVQLEQRARGIDWARWVRPNARVLLRVTCRKSRLYHSDAVAERLARAVSDAIAGAEVLTRSSDDDAPDDRAQQFVVRLAENVCTVSADAAGAPLYHRGYRLETAKAPIRETLAAAMLIGAGWDRRTPLVDPFCGAGTIVIEAAAIARNVAPGLRRSFAAERWPAAASTVWATARDAATAAIVESARAALVGSDRDVGAIEAARSNAVRAGVADFVEFSVVPVSECMAPPGVGHVITNPPYGVRIGDPAVLRDLYARFGEVLRTRFAGWRCAYLSADRSRGHVLERQTGLDLRPVWYAENGGIPVRLLEGRVIRTRSRTRD